MPPLDNGMAQGSPMAGVKMVWTVNLRQDGPKKINVVPKIRKSCFRVVSSVECLGSKTIDVSPKIRT